MRLPIRDPKNPTPDERFLRDAKFLVTGGHGFLGKHLIAELGSLGVTDQQIIAPTHSHLDLKDPGATEWWLEFVKPTVVIHAAAVVGGIGANQERPGEFFYDNLLMGVGLIDAARRIVPRAKIVTVGTVCAYPKVPPTIPFVESELWAGYPEETNAPYGIAKKALLVMGQAYRQQYGTNAIYLLPTNMYGPGDDFDERTSHVIPALIKRVIAAKQGRKDRVVVWGSGSATRDFIYVRDAARAIIKAAVGWNDPEPLNIGSGEEVSIRQLVEEIVDIVGFGGAIVWDTTKPDGQPRRLLDNTKSRAALNWGTKWTLRTGLQETINWYLMQGLPGQMVMPLWDVMSSEREDLDE